MMKKWFCAVSSLVLLAGESSTAGLLGAPYLQAVTRNSIYVLVESDTRDTAEIQFGLDTLYGAIAKTESIEATTAVPPTFVHNIKLSGLIPETTYHYRASQGAEKSVDYTFRTAGGPGRPFRFGWMADCRTGTAVHDSIARRILDAAPVVLLYGGDLARNRSYEAFKTDFFLPGERALIARVPFFNATGNHEGWTTNTEAFTQAPASASGTQEYYSFDYGDMHVLVVNNEVPSIVGSPQYLFAAKDLATTQQRWKVVIAHRPAYCAGGHGDDTNMVAMTTNIFEKHGVDLVLAGHSHFYQHNLVHGIPHLVIGSAGAPLYEPKSAPYTVLSAKEYNYAIGDVDSVSLRLMVYNERGALLDSITLQKGSSINHPGENEGDAKSGLNLDSTDGAPGIDIPSAVQPKDFFSSLLRRMPSNPSER